MNFIELITSDYWIWFLILTVVAIIFVPAGFKGYYDFFKEIDEIFFKPRRGWIKARQRLPNDRVRQFWIHPTGKYVKFTTIEGKEIEQPLRVAKGWMLHEGNTPIVEFDENGSQLYLGTGTTASPISQEEITRGYKASYETGKLIGSVDFFNEIIKYIIIVLIVVVIVGGVNAYLSYNTNKIVQTPTPIDTNAIAQQTASLVVGKMTNATFNGVPTVG